MSIHAINSAFIRPAYSPSHNDFAKKSHRPAPHRPELRWFFGGIVNTDTERKLAAMMNARRSA